MAGISFQDAKKPETQRGQAAKVQTSLAGAQYLRPLWHFGAMDSGARVADIRRSNHASEVKA
jgi:hypothetical protein